MHSHIAARHRERGRAYLGGLLTNLVRDYDRSREDETFSPRPGHQRGGGREIDTCILPPTRPHALCDDGRRCNMPVYVTIHLHPGQSQDFHCVWWASILLLLSVIVTRVPSIPGSRREICLKPDFVIPLAARSARPNSNLLGLSILVSREIPIEEELAAVYSMHQVCCLLPKSRQTCDCYDRLFFSRHNWETQVEKQEAHLRE